MPTEQSRRHFLTSASVAAAAGVLGARGSLADEGPPETTTVRLLDVQSPSASRRLLIAQGPAVRGGIHRRPPTSRGAGVLHRRRSWWRAGTGHLRQQLRRNRRLADGLRPASHGAVRRASRVLRAVRARARSHGVSDLKGQSVAIQNLSSACAPATSSPSWRRTSGSTRPRTISTGSPTPDQPHGGLCSRARPTRFLAFPPEPRSCATRGIGRVIISTVDGQALVAVPLLHARSANTDYRSQPPDRDQAVICAQS